MRDWKLASSWGSLRRGDPDDPEAAFHAGHINDVLRLDTPPANPLLVASDTSGVWLVNEHGGPALPLSESWTQPDLQCLAQGTRGAMHVFAGGIALYETDTTQQAPLLSWRPVIMSDGHRGTVNVGRILAMTVVRERGAIVLATDTGIWWAVIPAGGGATYTFTQAQLLPGLPMPGRRYSGVTEGPASTVVAACWGSDRAAGYGIFVGDWGGPAGSLQFTTRLSIFGLDDRKMLCTKVASFAKDRNQMYAVCSGSGVTPKRDPNGHTTPDGYGGLLLDGDDFILAVLRSKDGGQQWSQTNSIVRGQTLPLFPGAPGSDVAGHTQFGYNLCIGVSPFHEDLVAVGVGASFLSTDGGQTWDPFAPETGAHRHADTHACVFDTLDPATLHVCSDGGIATTPDLGKSWTTAGNRQLPNLQVRRLSAAATTGCSPPACRTTATCSLPSTPLQTRGRRFPRTAATGSCRCFCHPATLCTTTTSRASRTVPASIGTSGPSRGPAHGRTAPVSSPIARSCPTSHCRSASSRSTEPPTA